jgi:hypothetical protein
MPMLRVAVLEGMLIQTQSVFIRPPDTRWRGDWTQVCPVGGDAGNAATTWAGV